MQNMNILCRLVDFFKTKKQACLQVFVHRREVKNFCCFSRKRSLPGLGEVYWYLRMLNSVVFSVAYHPQNKMGVSNVTTSKHPYYNDLCCVDFCCLVGTGASG